MSRHEAANSCAGKPIPVGRLVSVTIGKKRTPLRRQATATQAARSRWSAEKAAVSGGVVALLVFAVLGVVFVQSVRKATKAGATEALTVPETAAISIPSAKQPVARLAADVLVSGLAEIIALVPEPAEQPAVESIAFLPREVPEAPEVVLAAPREVAQEPVVETPPEKPEMLAIAVDKARDVLELKLPGMPERVIQDACSRFGTKVDFLPTPTKAIELAAKNKDKLVMVLHIAGNFEEPGFT